MTAKQEQTTWKWLATTAVGVIILLLSGILGVMWNMQNTNESEHKVLLENATWTHNVFDYVTTPTKARSLQNEGRSLQNEGRSIKNEDRLNKANL